jgi:serine/threonine protein kinase
VTEFLRAKVSDFGTSRAQGVDSDEVAMTAVGTPLFCAPEILRGEAYGASADVYSFGLLLLAMVSNHATFFESLIFIFVHRPHRFCFNVQFYCRL